jgi:hypothetical protein
MRAAGFEEYSLQPPLDAQNRSPSFHARETRPRTLLQGQLPELLQSDQQQRHWKKLPGHGLIPLLEQVQLRGLRELGGALVVLGPLSSHHGPVRADGVESIKN